MTTITRNNQTIKCELTLLEGETITPSYLLETNCRGFKNSYRIKTKICGLDECKEDSLYFGVSYSECLNLDNTNEETLINKAIQNIFEELTQSRFKI
jgi:hypothetical protein